MGVVAINSGGTLASVDVTWHMIARAPRVAAKNGPYGQKRREVPQPHWLVSVREHPSARRVRTHAFYQRSAYYQQCSRLIASHTGQK